ncbi:MAG: right-handed parallel beta-helix repeat-containing protein, partial [Acidimicrobiales bacterium]
MRICGNAQVLDGPRVRPRGAIRVRAGYDNPHGLEQPHRTYWFAPGRHTLGSGEYSQIVPGNDSTYTGAPGATIDGEHVNDYAFTQHATGVTIEHLTIENFGQPGGNGGQGVVNHDSGSNWRILDNTIEHNAGAGVMLGTNDVLSSNCLTRNGEYGFSVYSPNTPSNVTVTANEVSYNDTDNWEQRVPGCGCAGGAKFWKTKGAVVT